MCGIIGFIYSKPKQNIYNHILNGLYQLQNRGYDSAGIGILSDNTFYVKKYASNEENIALERLKAESNEIKNYDNVYMGIGHNRWATHGGKTDTNSHPHVSNCGLFMLVHNGIIENYQILKNFLINNGYEFKSQTDTEVIVNLISYYFKIHNNTYTAIELAIGQLKGTFGLVIIDKNDDKTLYCVRHGSPILIGFSQAKDYVIISSEQNGFCNMISKYITLQNYDICVIKRSDMTEQMNMTEHVDITNPDHITNPIQIQTQHLYESKDTLLITDKLNPAPYEHWTLKEIMDQPNIVLSVTNNGGRIKNDSEIKLGGLEQNTNQLSKISNIILLGCGTSYFAGLFASNYFKSLCNFNTVQTIDGADFSIIDLPKNGNTALILISQSGETKDLHRCIQIAKEHNILTIGAINCVDSLIAREVDCGVYLNAGREMAVASTKAFMAQTICLSMIAIWFAQIHNINETKRIQMIADLKQLSSNITNTINMVSNKIQNIANNLVLRKINSMFVLGKGLDESIAKEGSLKIKEISYIHAEGYSASSLKHGPFALLDQNLPVVLLDNDNVHHAKILNCYEEVKSRLAPIIIISNNQSVESVGPVETTQTNSSILNIDKNNSYQSLLGIIPLQLLAYYLSVGKKINPDVPRNLAKVVTVE